jgi:hypothetical protein
MERWIAKKIMSVVDKEILMKFSFFARIMLMDCGRASKQTRGTFSGVLAEAGPAPFTRYPG